MQYDDGFVAFINGTEVASANAPGRNGQPGSLSWLSTATGSHNDRDAVRYETFDLANFADTLKQGDNVLAIHALNRSTSDDDLLMLPQIVVGREVLPDASILLAFNEMAAGDGNNFWLEIANDGSTPVDLAGMVLVATGQTGGQYTFPAQTLQPGGLLSLTGEQLGFQPADGDTVFLYSAGKENVIDGRAVTGRLRGRSELFGDQWLYPATATPGGANSFQFQDDIVINEIMYHAQPGEVARGRKAADLRADAVAAVGV